jgi:hypothetical protein
MKSLVLLFIIIYIHIISSSIILLAYSIHIFPFISIHQLALLMLWINNNQF